MNPGDSVTVELADGRRVEGQVWALAEKGYVWLALGNGRFGKVAEIRPGEVTSERGQVVGRVIERVTA